MADGAEILQLINRFDRASNGLESDAIARVHGIFDASFRAMEAELRRAYPELQSIGGLVAAQQKTLILDRMGGLLQLLNPDQAADYDRLFQELLTLSNETGGDLAGQLIQAYEDESLEPFTGIPVEAVVNQATEGRRRLYRYSEDFQDKANIIIGMGLSQGWGVRRVESALRSELGVAKGKAETLARTEVMSALNQSAVTRYKQNGIEHVQWWNSPSEGLCPFCANRNGKVYKADEVVYPLHPRDRCFLSPWKPEWQAKGITDDKFAAEYRQQGIDELAKRGLTPNSGLAPFEKAAKLDKPPTAVWQPGDDPVTPTRQSSQQTPQPQQSQSRSQRSRSTLQTAEDRIVGQSTETAILFDKDGGQLWEKDGGESEVRFSTSEVRQMRDGILTHNHPLDARRATRGSGFSQGDVDLLFRSGLSELRAVSGDYEYSLRPGSEALSQRQWRERGLERWNAIAEEEIAAVRKWQGEEIAKGRNSEDVVSEMNFRVWHRITGRFASEFDLTYSRQKRLGAATPDSATSVAKPTLKAREINSDAIPDLSARDFRRYLANKEDIATQNDHGQPWNQSFAEYKAATGRNKSAYQADVIDAVRDGFIPSSNTLADLKLNKTLNTQIQQNRQSAEEREQFQGLIQKAVDQPLLTNRDAAGYKPRMTREEAAQYTDGSYFGSTEFFHGNGKTVTDSVANDGAQPERNRRGLYGMGFYMGVDRSIGEHYARYAHGNDIGIVTAVTKVQNPYVSTVSEMARLGQNFEGDQSNGIDAVAVHQFLRAKGYDSIYLKDSGYSIAFDQRQVVIVEYEDVSNRRDELADYQTDTEERENVARNPNGARFLQIDNSESINYTEQWSDDDDDDDEDF